MTTDLQKIALRFLGICAIILVSAVAYGAVTNNSIDVSCSTIAGTIIGAIGGFLTNSAAHPPPPGTTSTTTTTTPRNAADPGDAATRHEAED